eukprot:m.103603 g.103603  ORF g.103603 m.103603 type:complete len:60 (+) comp15226_c0_seq6:2557-2736(+)
MGVLFSAPVCKLNRMINDRHVDNDLQATMDQYQRDVATHKQTSAPETAANSTTTSSHAH